MATANDILKKAASQIGYCRWDDAKEGTKYGRWYAEKTGSSYYGTNGVPFCAMGVSWTFEECGQSLPGLPTAGCGDIRNANRNTSRHIKNKKQAKPGDVVLFRWDGDTDNFSYSDHVGLVEKNCGSYIQTIEFNTTGSDGRSGSVARRTRDWSVVQMIVRPSYSSSSSTKPSKPSNTKPSNTSVDLGSDLTIWGPLFTKELQRQLKNSLVDGKISGQYLVNNEYFWAVEQGTVLYTGEGSECIERLQKLCKKNGYSVGSDGCDGQYGPNSIKAHQKMLKKWGYSVGPDGVDGYHGHNTNKAMAQALKDGKYKQ